MHATRLNLFQIIFILSLLGLSIFPTMNAAPRCTAPRATQSEDCVHGLVKDYCGRDICARGPGQRCGGKWNYHGQCGEGLFCSCERCTGCSLKTLECYDEPCIGYNH